MEPSRAISIVNFSTMAIPPFAFEAFLSRVVAPVWSLLVMSGE